MEQSSVQAQGYRGEGDIQGEETEKGKLLRVWFNSDDVVLEGAHGEASRQKGTSDDGGGYWGGGTSDICGLLLPGAEDGEMPGDRLCSSST